MAVLPILVYPDERLKRRAAPVTAFDAALRRFLVDLEDTLRASPGCVGLAAPQLDYPQRIVLVDVSARPKIPHHGRLLLVNPQIVGRAGETLGREGCLSVPDYTGNVLRAETVRLRYQDADGAAHELECSGYEARAVQHELDHLDGLLFLDRLAGRHDLFRRKVYR